MKVIGIGKLYLTIDLVKLYGRNASLDSGTRADVHKHRRLNIAVYGMENASARPAILC